MIFVSEFKNREVDLQKQIELANENMKKLQTDNIEKNNKITDLEVMMNQMKIDSDASEKRHKKHMEDAERRHKEIIGYAEYTKDQLDHLTDIVEDHNETLPDKFADVVKPLADNFVQSPNENSLKARFAVLSIGNGTELQEAKHVTWLV